MNQYAVTSNVTFEVTEGSDSRHTAIGRACLLFADYEVSDAELEGYNNGAGVEVSSVSAQADSSLSTIVRAEGDVTVSHIHVNIVVETPAADESAARNIAADTLELFNFDPFFLAGYNSRAETHFTGVSIDNVEVADVQTLDQSLAA